MSIIEMVVRSKSLHRDTLIAHAFREAVGLDSRDDLDDARRRHRADVVDEADYARIMSQRYGALDRVR